MLTTQKHVLNTRRIVAGTLILISLGANALAVIYVHQERKLVEETITATTWDHGRVWARLCAAEMEAGDDSTLSGVIEAIGQSDEVRLAMLISPSGRVVAATDPSQIGRKHRLEDDTLADDRVSGAHRARELLPKPTGFFQEAGHTFEFAFPVRSKKQDFGTLVLQINTASGNRQAKALAMKGLAMVFAVTVLIGLTAIILDARMRRAVKTIIAANQAIAKGERAPDIHLDTGDDLEILGESVKEMAQALQNTEERAAQWHRTLEATIAMRTAQLEESQQLLAEREKMAALGLMAAGIVHEVGNPLTAMSTIVQRIQRKADAELGDKCRVLTEQIARISRIVDDMRQVARPVPAEGCSTNINETLRTAIKVTQYDPRSKAVDVHADLAPTIPRVSGHADRWQQVFINVIINAMDAMPHGGQLTISTAVADDLVVITFGDTGNGMSPEQIKHLYQPFYTTKASGGMGLGLAVCNSIVRSYGGDISVTSQPGKGTEFRLTMPPYGGSAGSRKQKKSGGDQGSTRSATLPANLAQTSPKATR